MTFDEYVKSVTQENKSDELFQTNEKQDFSWLNMRIRKTKSKLLPHSNSAWLRYILEHPANYS